LNEARLAQTRLAVEQEDRPLAAEDARDRVISLRHLASSADEHERDRNGLDRLQQDAAACGMHLVQGMMPHTYLAISLGTLGLLACSSTSSSSPAPSQPTQTTSAKVDPKNHAEALERLDRSTEVVTTFQEKIPNGVAHATRCVVAIPSMVKAGLVIGGQSGKGYASCQTAEGWSPPAPVSIGGGSLGAQIGAQSTDVLALVTSPKGTTGLLSGNFNIGVDASASAGPVGAGRGTSTDVNTSSDLVSYSRAKGLFAGAELNGSTLKADEDTTRTLYGSNVQLRDILTGRAQMPNDPAVQRFLGALRGGFGKER
jgi:lipid-binding SYLF domain-containing protein